MHKFFTHDALEGSGGWSLLPQVAKEEQDDICWTTLRDAILLSSKCSCGKKIGCSPLQGMCLHIYIFWSGNTFKGDTESISLRLFCLSFICLFFFFLLTKWEEIFWSKKKESTWKHWGPFELSKQVHQVPPLSAISQMLIIHLLINKSSSTITLQFAGESFASVACLSSCKPDLLNYFSLFGCDFHKRWANWWLLQQTRRAKAGVSMGTGIYNQVFSLFWHHHHRY